MGLVEVFSLSLLSLLLLAAKAQLITPRCNFTKDVLETIPGSLNEVFSSPKRTAGTMCQLDQTCCSVAAEELLQQRTVEKYNRMTKSALTDRLQQCREQSIFGDMEQLVKDVQKQLVADLKRTYKHFYNPDLHDRIFDGFFAFLIKAIKTGDTSELTQEFEQMFFEVYLASFLAFPGSSLPPSARQCFYDYYNSKNGGDIRVLLNTFKNMFSKTMHYLRSLRAIHTVIDNVGNYTLSEQCKVSLPKMADCGICAGYPASSLRSCNGLCLNVLRGCLLDLADLEEPIASFFHTLVTMKDHVVSYDLLNALNDVEQPIFEMIGDVQALFSSIQGDLAVECNIRRKRSIHTTERRDTGIEIIRTARQAAVFPHEMFNSSAYCSPDIMETFSELPDLMCDAGGVTGASGDNHQCWNGRSHGSYSREVTTYKRLTQVDNPEILICPNDVPQFSWEINLLRLVTKEMAIITGTCSPDDEDCGEITPTTHYYDFSSVPTKLQVTKPTGGDDDSVGSGSGSGSGDETINHDSCISNTISIADIFIADTNDTNDTNEPSLFSGASPGHSYILVLPLAVVASVLLVSLSGPWSL